MYFSGALRKNEFKYFVAMLVIMYMATIHLNSFLRKAPDMDCGGRDLKHKTCEKVTSWEKAIHPCDDMRPLLQKSFLA